MSEMMPENKIEPMPYQKSHPMTSLYREAPNKREFMAAMMKNGININGENITPIDFFSSSPDLTDEEITEAINGYLEVENFEVKLEMINEAIEKAKDYIENYLHKKLPKEIERLAKMKNADDVLKLFRKTATAKVDGKIGLAPAYCGLVAVAVAAFEFRKEELGGLIKESEFLYNSIFEESENNETRNFHRFKKNSSGYDKIFIYDEKTNDTAMVSSYFRGKTEDSFISKFLNKPEANAAEAAKDGIGIKFEVRDKNEIKNLVSFLAKYFGDKFNAKDFYFKNTKLFNKVELTEVIKGINSYLNLVEGDRDEFKINLNEEHNPHSNERFQAFKIWGKLSVPKNGDAEGMRMERDFEIQIVLNDNKNETKFSNHHIYEASKKLSIVSRLFGSFTEEYLDLICAEASARSNIADEEIKKYIKETFLVRVKSANDNKNKYAVEKNVKRFVQAGIFSKDIKIR